MYLAQVNDRHLAAARPVESQLRIYIYSKNSLLPPLTSDCEHEVRSSASAVEIWDRD